MADLIDILEGNSASVGIGRGNGNAPVTFGLDQDGSFVGTASFGKGGVKLIGAVVTNDEYVQINGGGSLGIYRGGGGIQLSHEDVLEKATAFGGVGKSTPNLEFEKLKTQIKVGVEARATITYERVVNPDEFYIPHAST